MTHRLGSKGQVVVPKRLRAAFDLEPGDQIVFWDEGDHVALKRLGSTEPLRGRFGDLDVDLVTELEAERRRERAREDTAR